MGLLDKLQDFPGLTGLSSLMEGTNGGIVRALARIMGDSGGLNALLDSFRAKGMEAQVNSWIGRGRNLPVTPDQVADVLGQERLHQIADAAGVKPLEAKTRLATLLPTLVDRMTPDGSMNVEFISRGLSQLVEPPARKSR